MFCVIRRVLLLAVTAIGIAACSTHPLTDDFPRTTTFDIVKNLLCEAQVGIRNVGIGKAERQATVIGFDFTFDITEQNKASSGSFDFLYPFGGGHKFSLNISGGAEKKRQAERFVRVLHTFDELHDKTTCTDPIPRENLVYPITGQVGLGEIVSTYSRLRRETSLQGNQSFNGAVFSDKLNYTTTLKAGIRPTIELKSVAGAFRLTKGTIDGAADRTDVHKVTIAISTKAAGKETTKSFTGLSIRRVATPGAAGDAAAVVNELDRLRNRDDDLKTLETLRVLPIE